MFKKLCLLTLLTGASVSEIFIHKLTPIERDKRSSPRESPHDIRSHIVPHCPTHHTNIPRFNLKVLYDEFLTAPSINNDI